MQFIQKRKKKYCKSKVNMKHHPNGRLKNIIVFSTLAKYLCGTQDGAVAKVPACHQCGAGANSSDDTMSEMSLFLILSLTLSGFSLVTPFFLRPQKPGMVHEEPLCVCGLFPLRYRKTFPNDLLNKFVDAEDSTFLIQ